MEYVTIKGYWLLIRWLKAEVIKLTQLARDELVLNASFGLLDFWRGWTPWYKPNYFCSSEMKKLKSWHLMLV